MAPISEVCAHTCQARIDLLPSMPLAEAKKIISEWRKNHNHITVEPAETAERRMGFALPDLVSNDYNDGEDAQPVGDGALTGPQYDE